MLLALDTTQAVEMLESPETIREDQVIPGHFRPCKDSPYRTGFDWIYRYKRKIAPALEPLLRSDHGELAGEKGLLYEALTNAYCHGHQKERLMPITVSVLYGRKGLIVRVADHGKGFKVKKVYKHYVQKRRHFTSVGNGINLMAESTRFGVYYNTAGTEIDIIYLFDNGIAALSSELIVSASEPQFALAG